MEKCADRLIDEIIKNRSCVVVGLDPVINRIPHCYKKEYINDSNLLKATAKALFDFNKDVIDSVCGLVCAVKPQIAFYEIYGAYGIEAFENTVNYAKSRGLIVIEDGKRNDIGNTAKAYSSGHLGEVELINGQKSSIFNNDFLTISPYLGSESIEPFIEDCEIYNKGIFILVKTSNKDSAEIQDQITQSGLSVSESIADYVNKQGDRLIGDKYNYSALGAVVGATYPEQAKNLRKIMRNNIFLVPGYGAQGATADTIVPYFNEDGLGAIINSSRNILYSYENLTSIEKCDFKLLKSAVKSSCTEMRDKIYYTLKSNYSGIVY